jgi:hypothetical protein
VGCEGLSEGSLTGLSRKADAPGLPKNALILALNQPDNIAKIIGTLFELYPDIHVLVADDHSPDPPDASPRDCKVNTPI